MDQSQSFRVIGTTQIVTIPVQHVGGQTVVSWESIEQVFPGVKCVKNADVAVPRCIQYFPGVVLDVDLSSTSESIPINSSMGTPSTVPTATQNSALTMDQNGAPANLPTVPSSENKSIDDLQATSALADMPGGSFGVRRPSTTPSILQPSSSSTVETASNTTLSFIEALKRASKKAAETAGQVQQQNLSAKMDHMIKSQEEMKQLQEEMKQLQKASDAKQEKLNHMQKQLLENQEEMKLLQQRALDQLSVLQSRVQAALTQTYELHEYPIPRLFIVLPQYPAGWNILEPFTDKYRLYFLCECGEHTKAAGSNSKIPHEIHLAKHEGYEITRPTEFFQQYGPYVLTMLKMLKFTVSVASVAVPAVAHLINADALDHAAKGLQHLKDCIEPGMDQMISKIEKDSVDEGDLVESFTDRMENKEALEGADLRKLETFLKDKDGNKVLGNLYRTGLIKLSNFTPRRPPHLRKLSFEMVIGTTVRIHGEILETGSTETTLYLWNNSIADNGAQALAEALKTYSTVATLDLHNNSIGPDGAKALAEALKTNSTVVTLDLHNNSIGSDGAKALAEALKTNSTLASLNLFRNSVGDDGAKALAEALKTNSTLTTLNLRSNSIGYDGAKTLAEALKTNRTKSCREAAIAAAGSSKRQVLSDNYHDPYIEGWDDEADNDEEEQEEQEDENEDGDVDEGGDDDSGEKVEEHREAEEEREDGEDGEDMEDGEDVEDGDDVDEGTRDENLAQVRRKYSPLRTRSGKSRN
ncbi:unnamed protein product [Mortierella alpina]